VESPPGTEAIVALGCRVKHDAAGRLAGALARRVRTAADEYARRRGRSEAPLVVASGGRHWNGALEADAMAHELVLLGVSPDAVVRERCSLSTSDNARFVAAALTRRGIARATVVTCTWHLPRAVALFRAAGIEVAGIGAVEPGPAPRLHRVWRYGRERFLTWAQRSR
jgi:uncharacterized SAM-binding protein YcdF (DUF218 family)